MTFNITEYFKKIGYVPTTPSARLPARLPLAESDKRALGLNASAEEPWDYKTATLGRDGSPLPKGALGWQPNGEAYYGGGTAIENWFNGLMARITAPTKKPVYGDWLEAADKISREADEQIASGDILGGLYKSGSALLTRIAGGLGDLGEWAGGFGLEEGQSPEKKFVEGDLGEKAASILPAAGRAVSEVVGGTLALLQQFDKYLEQGIGAVRGIAEVGGYKDDPFVTQIHEADYGHFGFLRDLILKFTLVKDPIALGLAAGKALAEDPQAALRGLEEGWTAGQIMYSTSGDPALKAEFVRRWRAGENAYLLAEELQNPVKEMFGSILGDPLELIAPIFKGMRLSGQVQDATRLVGTADDLGVAKFLENGRVASNVADATTRSGGIIQATQKWMGELKTGLAKSDSSLFHRKGLKLFSPLDTASKRNLVVQRTGAFMGNIMAEMAKKPGNIDRSTSVLKAFFNLGSDNAGEVQKALDIFQKEGISLDIALSRVGGEFSAVLREVMSGGNKINPKAFLDDIASAKNVDGLLSKYGERIDKAITNLIPPMKKGANLTTAAEAITGSKVYTGAREFFGNVYMGWNPGYFFRALSTDVFHVFTDVGAGTVLEKGRLFNAQAVQGDLQAMFGYVPGGAVEGFVQDGTKSKALFSRLAAKGQGHMGSIAFYKGAKDAFSKQYKVLSKTTFGTLKEAGLSDDVLRMLERKLNETFDTDKAADWLREQVKQGYVDDATAWVDDVRYGTLDQFEKLKQYKAAMSNATTLEEKIAAHNDIIKGWEDYAKEAAKVPARLPASMVDAPYHEASRAVQDGLYAENTYTLANTQRIVNVSVEDAFEDVLTEASRLAKQAGTDLNKIPKFRELLDGTFRQQMNDLYHKRVDPLFAVYRGGLLKEAKSADVSKYWELLGLKGKMPEGMTKDALTRYFWEGIYYPRVRNMFAKMRDKYAEEVGKVVEQIIGAKENRLINNSMLKQARDKLEEAALWDTAAIGADGLGVLGSQLNDIRKLAIMNGIATASAEGVPSKQLLNIINKYRPEGIAKFTDEAVVPYQVAENAIKQYISERGGKFNPMLEKINPVQRPIPGALIPPVSKRSDTMFTPTRNIAEQIVGLRKLGDDLLEKLKKTGGKQPIPTSGSPDIDNAINDWQKLVKPENLKIKSISERAGQAMRDFTVLPYGTGRTNIDTVLGVFYPYAFWHSRTYVNWVKRLAYNPGLVAAYAKYRDAMAEIHADAPEWWKYNIRSDEALGLFKDNPLFFNLEATFNPVNALTATDFRDPYKRVNWWSTVIDDLGKFGPSPWTFLQWGTALALHMQGEDEAAARWVGRLFPQTQALESLGVAAGLDTYSLDPAHWLVGGDPYRKDQARAALAAMVDEGLITNDQAIDASVEAKGEVWDMAMQRAIGERAPGQLTSFFLGTGFRARTLSDLRKDEFYSEYYRLMQTRDNMSPQQYRLERQALAEKYPFMDSVLVGKKAGDERDTALAYNVLGRLPPGGSELAQLVGLDPRLQDKFYEDKGEWDDWAKTDRDRFMAAVNDLRVVLATPANATRDEWNLAKNAYTDLQDAMKTQFGDDILNQIDNFYAMYREDDSVRPNPLVEQALNFKQRAVAMTPILTTYYGGIDAVAKYWEGLMWDDIAAKMGEDIFARFSDGTITSRERKQYYALKDQWYAKMDANILKIASYLPEAKGATVRDDAQPTTQSQQDFIQGLEPLQIDERQVIDALGNTGYEIVLDFLQNGGTLPYQTRNKLLDLADSMGISMYALLDLLRTQPVIIP